MMSIDLDNIPSRVVDAVVDGLARDLVMGRSADPDSCCKCGRRLSLVEVRDSNQADRKKTMTTQQTRTQAEFDAALAKWLEGAQAIINDYMQRWAPQSSTLRVMAGRRYLRIVSDYRSRMAARSEASAWAFIDCQTGDILRPKSWGAPAKHARGNLFDKLGGLGGIGPYGPAYL